MLINQPRTSRLGSILLKEGNEPIPVLWYWILRELRTIPVFKNSNGSKYKIVPSYCSNFFDFQWNNIPLGSLSTAHQPPVISTTRDLVYIIWSLRTLLLKFTMIICTSSFTRFFQNFCYTVVKNILPGTLKTFKKRRFFLWAHMHRLHRRDASGATVVTPLAWQKRPKDSGLPGTGLLIPSSHSR